MWGCSDPNIVYGWYGKTNLVLSWEFLEEYGIERYASETIRATACDPIYGLQATFDSSTGQASISDEDRETVTNAYMKQGGSDISELKFILCISGDMSWECHEEYYPDSSDKSE